MTEGRADVEILGQRLSVRGPGTPEYIQDLAGYLNQRVQTVREQARIFDPLRLSLLAGLHVADDLFRARTAEAELAASLGRLAERLGAALDGPPGT
jgi:cell division protein ZapA